ncbi:uncharacterized protein BDZ83DRAFT_62496 [Colletotrichum acutatum]|uniref:Uncharacterized protein n=1 Tax=Glomerella acutata TaxID=27357 RepID=A0AAD8UBN5_GLOAC|nr:uncharacterized protein BDZ83DRAFT_62496 [Colletotrichum acutatum]KAK1714919.1 hypothetical protein BDZ83DRAFT_62496 [Colletotrichum acutatum]
MPSQIVKRLSQSTTEHAVRFFLPTFWLRHASASPSTLSNPGPNVVFFLHAPHVNRNSRDFHVLHIKGPSLPFPSTLVCRCLHRVVLAAHRPSLI